jgi:hypothetical protein
MFEDENRQFSSISISVKILETVVRQSEVLVHRQKWLFCKVTSVYMQAFMEGLRRLANVLEATHGTPKNVKVFMYIFFQCL